LQLVFEKYKHNLKFIFFFFWFLFMVLVFVYGFVNEFLVVFIYKCNTFYI